MPISWNEIKNRTLKYSHEWADDASEDAEAKSFWDAFFTVFGVPRRGTKADCIFRGNMVLIADSGKLYVIKSVFSIDCG
jgi:hypothetical protein